MKLEIITPDTNLYTGNVNLVQLPGLSGSFEILKNHAPLVSILVKGRIKIEDDNQQTHFIEINGGVVEVLKNKVLVLAE
ncbi:MAG: ATP synthase F1 subunit epsilon [Bacteroidetes bacterium]|jgi:F-type H+-transporting ATPase subunit epsilon|nr:ATP synthase F1 subunit epsilon [Bacteroidota bacterium]